MNAFLFQFNFECFSTSVSVYCTYNYLRLEREGGFKYLKLLVLSCSSVFFFSVVGFYHVSYWKKNHISYWSLQEWFSECLLWQIGKTKVFLRAGQMAELDACRTEVLGRSAMVVQRKVRSYLGRKNFILLRLAAIQIQALCRGIKLINLNALCMLVAKQSILVAKQSVATISSWDCGWRIKIIKITKWKIVVIKLVWYFSTCFYLFCYLHFFPLTGQIARQHYEDIRMEAASIKIQKYWRMHFARCCYKRICTSAVAIQAGIHGMVARKELKFRRQTRAAIIIQVER